MSRTDADQLVHSIASDWRLAKLNDADRRLCEFASNLTHEPWKMTEIKIGDLQHVGFDDAAIHDATQVISYFNYINRVADALNVDPETDIHAWEESVPSRS